jgi:hypothetical protein
MRAEGMGEGSWFGRVGVNAGEGEGEGAGVSAVMSAVVDSTCKVNSLSSKSPDCLIDPAMIRNWQSASMWYLKLKDSTYQVTAVVRV